jgi:transcriptional regulator with XRE-family HTH domain
MAVDKTEIAILKLFGERMAEARKLCSLTQQQAAERLGITPEHLRKIEEGIDVKCIPAKVIRQASLVFDVTCDFLLGFSDDWEVSEETKMGREIGAWLHQQQVLMFSMWAVKQLQLERQVEAMAVIAGTLPSEIEAVGAALAAFKKMNPDFDRLPCGSQLQYRINKASEKAGEARCALIRSKVTG